MVGALMYGLLHGMISFFRLIRLWRWRVEGVANLPPRQSGGMIIAMNHISWIDILAVGGLLPFAYRLSWLGKAELFDHPISRWFFRNMNVIPINRGRRDMAALDTSVEALRAGAVLLIFPEGHRSRSGVLQTGRGGAIRLAMQSGVPIVPLAISGSEHGLRGSFLRRPLTIQIGQPYLIPLTPNGKLPADLMNQLTEDMMQRVAAMLPEDRRGPYAQLPAHSP
ncbi:MAG: lysophospholipid acyltransferase family protein [Chloroflexales bacterium]